MKKLGLIGQSLSHSFSKKYFTDKFKAQALTGWSYELFELENIHQFPVLIETSAELRGLNVTIPYKEAVIPFLHQLDETAREVGAVNTITIQRQAGAQPFLTGYNTDFFGFRESLRPVLRRNHQQALILGTGGAAKAVAAVLRSMGIKFIRVSRTPATGVVPYGDLNEQAVRSFPLIINCTPLGMYPHAESFPEIPYEFLNESNFLYDLVYNPAETRFLKKGKEKGALVMNGMDMLRMQAEKAWEIFTSGS